MGYETVGNSFVRWGTLLVAAGALIFSGGWFLLGIYKQVDERLKKWRWFKTTVRRAIVIFISVTILLVTGSWMVGRGGTLTTKGWNIISLGEQRNNLIRAITQEWLSNSARLISPPMKGETYYVREDGEYVWRPFPTLRTNALNTILSSGFWDYGNQMDRKFLDAVADYERKVSLANRKFRSYDNVLSKIRDPNERIMQTKKVVRLTYEKDWFKSLENRQSQVGKLVWSEYKWAITTQLPEASKLLRQRFQEKSPVGESEE